jgi:hypothetical protein
MKTVIVSSLQELLDRLEYFYINHYQVLINFNGEPRCLTHEHLDVYLGCKEHEDRHKRLERYLLHDTLPEPQELIERKTVQVPSAAAFKTLCGWFAMNKRWAEVTFQSGKTQLFSPAECEAISKMEGAKN